MLNQDFREFIQSLNDNQVRYLVVGGYAVAIHSYPRSTKDIDMWIDMNPENARRILQSLEQFGFGSQGLKQDDFLEAEMIVQLGIPPRRVDLLTSLVGVNFETCYADKVIVDIEGMPVNFVDLENLKQNKQSSGRAQDLADIENLE